MDKILVSFLKNWLAKNSKIGNVIKIVSIAIAVITGLPALLESSGLVLSESIQIITSKVVSIAAVISAFIAQLSNDELEK